jgi:hypothetical protein
MLLLNLLSIFFIFLILYQIFSDILENKSKFREGMDVPQADNIPNDPPNHYKEYNENDPVILSKQNAGNISYLKQRLDKLEPLIPIVSDLSANMIILNNQMIALTQSQSSTLQQINNAASLSVSGTPSSG